MQAYSRLAQSQCTSGARHASCLRALPVVKHVPSNAAINYAKTAAAALVIGTSLLACTASAIELQDAGPAEWASPEQQATLVSEFEQDQQDLLADLWASSKNGSAPPLADDTSTFQHVATFSTPVQANNLSTPTPAPVPDIQLAVAAQAAADAAKAAAATVVSSFDDEAKSVRSVIEGAVSEMHKTMEAPVLPSMSIDGNVLQQAQEALGEGLSGPLEQVAKLGAEVAQQPLTVGLGVTALVLGAWALTSQSQARSAEQELGDKIAALESDKQQLLDRKATLKGNVKRLEGSVSQLQASLSTEKQAKTEALARGDSLQAQLDSTARELKSVTSLEQQTSAKLTDTRADLQREREAGAALGEQVVDLSQQLSTETKRAEKGEQAASRLEKELAARSSELKEEHAAKTRLLTEMDTMRSNVQRLKEKLSQQAAGAQEQQRTAAQAKASADKAQAKITQELQGALANVAALEAKLAAVTDKLTGSQQEARELDERLRSSTSRASSLQTELEGTQRDLREALDVLDGQQTANSQLRADRKELQARVARLGSALEDTTSKLATEADVASEMKSQLAELKMEYIAAGDKLEAEQGVIRQLQVDLRNMESALNSVTHDKKNAQMENAQLGGQLDASEKKALAAHALREQADAKLAHTEAELSKYKSKLAQLETDLAVAIQEGRTRQDALQAEQQQRRQLEQQVADLNREVKSIQETERKARSHAQVAMQELRRDLEIVRAKARKPRAGGITGRGRGAPPVAPPAGGPGGDSARDTTGAAREKAPHGSAS